MVIICPGCKANFVIDDAQITFHGVKLRCCRCKAVFRIIRKKRSSHHAVQGIGGRPSHVVKFVVAHESPSFCEAVKRVVANEPFMVYDSNDGGEAMAIIERVKPDAVLLDVALPTMYGFEICEAIRQNPELARTKVILLAAIYDKRRYRRDPASLYGADEVIEKHRIPDELIGKVYSLVASDAPSSANASVPEPTVAQVDDWLAPTGTAPVSAWDTTGAAEQGKEWLEPTAAEATGALGNDGEPTPVERNERDSVAAMPATSLPDVEIETAPEPLPVELAHNFINEVTVEASAAAGLSATVLPAGTDDLPADHMKARRLARIIISDIALYNPEKVVRGVQEGTLPSLLAEEIAEGQALYAQRVAPEIRAESDYLGEALQNLIAKKQKEYAG
jgi:predicted Zn finger-like uncharacterized protein